MASFYSSNTSIHACAFDLTLPRDIVHLKSTCFYLWITYVIELLMDMLFRTCFDVFKSNLHTFCCSVHVYCSSQSLGCFINCFNCSGPCHTCTICMYNSLQLYFSVKDFTKTSYKENIWPICLSDLTLLEFIKFWFQLQSPLKILFTAWYFPHFFPSVTRCI